MDRDLPQLLDHTFTAPIEKDGAFATYLTVLQSCWGRAGR